MPRTSRVRPGPVAIGLTAAGLLAACAFGQAPVNDTCAGATAIGEGTFVGSTLTATSEPVVCVQIVKDVWYAYTPSCTGVALVSTCSSDGGGANFTTVIDAYSGSCGALTLLGCGYDTFGCNNGTRIQVEVAAGVPIYVRLGGMPLYPASAGAYALVVSCTPAPANDACSGAVPLAPGWNGPFSNAGATTDSAVAVPCSYVSVGQYSPGFGDVWFSWTATCGSMAKLELCSSTLAGYATVHAFCGGPPLACSAGYCGTSTGSFTATPGATYLVRVASIYGYGSFLLRVSCGWQLHFAAPSGPGSISMQSVNGVAFSPYFTAVTAFPQTSALGWFFGLNIPFPELWLEATWPGGAPFLGALDSNGDSPLALVPAGVPSGLHFAAVSVLIDSQGNPNTPTLLATFTTP